MISFLSSQLGNDYKLIEEGANSKQRSVKVYQNINNVVNLDTYVKLTLSNGGKLWDLILVQRDKEFSKAQFNNFEMGICALYIATDSILGPDKAKKDVRANLRSVGSDDSAAEKILMKHVSPSYFSLSKETKGAINLEKANNVYNASYLPLSGGKISIIKNRKTPSIFVVIYNYAVKLSKFDEIMNVWIKRINIDLKQSEKLKRIYLGK